MCRLFGFRSVISSQVHTSLISADNALMYQSPQHPDGWGVAYYIAESPHVIRSLTAAIDCQLFKKVSGIVSSQTVLAHLRKSTIGEHKIVNTHPFQFGRWTFAHNGNIKNFSKIEEKLKKKVKESLKGFILGNTDSELTFFLILSFLAEKTSLDNDTISLTDLAAACRKAIEFISQLSGPLHTSDSGPASENYLTFIITDGKIMLAFHGGKNLFYSTHKKLCPDRDHCSGFNKSCENPTTKGKVNHLLFSSEPVKRDNIWQAMKFKQMIGINQHMELFLDLS